MSYRVLVVDDSGFFQRRLNEIINNHPDLQVVGTASNGQEAIDLALSLKPDIITMDYEMPILNGVSAVREIMSRRPTPILMFSSMTYEGARITLDALEAGAVDFITKDFAEVSRNSTQLTNHLHERLLDIIRNHRLTANPPVPGSPAAGPATKPETARRTAADLATQPEPAAPRERTEPARLRGKVQLLIIGASTGGPVALTEVLTQLPASFPLPILLVQHMPENFTKAFAERLNKQCQIRVKEAETGDRLQPGLALLAPGGKQMMLDAKNRGVIQITDGNDRINYRPSLDITFASAANVFGAKTLGVVLTGMGADGCEGARLMKSKGAYIWSQDEASCVIYGMPMAVAKAGLSDAVVPLKELGAKLSASF